MSIYTLTRVQINKGNIPEAAFDNLKAGYPLYAEMVVTPTTGSAITIRDDDLIQGSFSIKRDATSGNTIRIGTAIASELSFKLNNNPAAQVETTTVLGTITGAGTATVVITALGMTGSPITRSVAVLEDDTASVVAGKIRTDLNGVANITNFFTVGGTGETITLTAKTATADDTTMNIGIDNNTCAGLTAVPTSVTTVYGKRGFDGFVFEGAEITAKCLWEKDASNAYEFALGKFTIDEVPKKLTSISITALDGMARFDRYFADSTVIFPQALDELVVRCCLDCGVTFDNANSLLTRLQAYTVTNRPVSDNLTYRQVIAWAAQLCGACAFIDWTGKLRITWYTTVSDAQFTTSDHKLFSTITASERYSSNINESDIHITGVKIIGNDKDKTEYLDGTEDYAIIIDGNLLAQSNLATLVSNLGDYLVGFTYRPYTATVKSFPHIWPLDGLVFTDSTDTDHESIVTNSEFRLKGNTILSGKGETAVKKGYATSNPLTSSQSAILERLSGQVASSLTSLEQMQLELNQSIANGMGLYTTTIDEGGVLRTYYHDFADLEDSEYIFTYNTGGFAWTKGGWNDGDPTWQFGFTADGNSILNTLSVYNITADQIAANSITADKIIVGAGDKNYVNEWDLSNWVDSTAPTASTMVTLTDSPIGGVTKARRTYAQQTNVHTIYNPSAEVFAVAKNETYSFEGFYKASVAGLRFRVNFVEQTSANIITTPYFTASGTSWTRFSAKLTIPNTWTVLTTRAGIEVQKRTVAPTSGTIDFTGISVKKTQTAAIITDGRIESVNKNTYLDLGTGELAVEGGDTKAVIANAGQKWDGDGFYIQGLFWTDKSTDINNWTDPNTSTLFEDAISLIYNYNTSYLGDTFEGLEIEHNTGTIDIFGQAGVNINAGSGKDVKIGNNILLPNDRRILGRRNMFNQYEAMLHKSTSDNTVIGAYTQSGHTNIYTHSGGRINFYVGTTRAGYVDSDGWHNG